MSQRELANKVALITGVSRRAGIGAAIARELAQAGAKVFVTFFRKYDEASSFDIRALARQAASSISLPARAMDPCRAKLRMW